MERRLEAILNSLAFRGSHDLNVHAVPGGTPPHDDVGGRNINHLVECVCEHRFWLSEVSLLRSSCFLPAERERQSSVNDESACDGRRTFLLNETGNATFVGNGVVDMVSTF